MIWIANTPANHHPIPDPLRLNLGIREGLGKNLCSIHSLRLNPRLHHLVIHPLNNLVRRLSPTPNLRRPWINPVIVTGNPGIGSPVIALDPVIIKGVGVGKVS